MSITHIGRPLPLPIMFGAPPSLFCDLGFLIVSSTDKTRHAASHAATRAFFLTTAGSQTHFTKLSEISSLVTSTPYQQSPAQD